MRIKFFINRKPLGFWKRGVAPLVPLILSAVILVSAMTLSLLNRENTQTIRSRAATIHATPTAGGGRCSDGTPENSCCQPVLGQVGKCVKTAFGTYSCSGTGCALPSKTPTKSPVPTRTPTPGTGRCSDGTQENACCKPVLGSIGRCVKTAFGTYSCSGSGCTLPTKTPTKVPTRTPTPYAKCSDGTPYGGCCKPGSDGKAYRCDVGLFGGYSCTGLQCSGPTKTPTKSPVPTRTPTKSPVPTRTPTPGTGRCSDGTQENACCKPVLGSIGRCVKTAFGTYSCSGSGCTLPTKTPTKVPTRTPTPYAKCSDGTPYGGCCKPGSDGKAYRCDVGLFGGYSCTGLQCSAPTRTPTPASCQINGRACTSSSQCCSGYCNLSLKLCATPVVTRTATPKPSATRVPPTATRVPPTATRVPPTATKKPVDPTNTPIKSPTRTRTPTRIVTKITPTGEPLCFVLGSCCANGRTCVQTTGFQGGQCSGPVCTAPTVTRTPTPPVCNFFLVGSAIPAFGAAPLNNVDLLARLTQQTNVSTTYRFKCNSSSSAWDKTITSTGYTYRAVDLCSYSSTGYKTARISVSRGGCTLATNVIISVGVKTPTPNPSIIIETLTPTRTPTQPIDYCNLAGGQCTNQTTNCTSVNDPNAQDYCQNWYGGKKCCYLVPPSVIPTRTVTPSSTRTPTPICDAKLEAIPSFGGTSVKYDLKATLNGGSGSITYKFNCNKSDGTVDKTVTTSSNPYTAIDVCSYSSNGQKTATVNASRTGCTANGDAIISVGVATPTRTRTPTRTPAPSRTRTPTISVEPSPTPAATAAGLAFAIQIPDVTAGNIAAGEVQVELTEGANIVETVNTELVRSGNYFQTANPVFFNSAQNQTYSIYVKNMVSLARAFTGVTLAQGQTLDCSTGSDPACGELLSVRDTRFLESGDSDGFDTTSGSYNKIDSADLQVLSLYFNQASGGAASAADFNIDGSVDISDLEIIGKNYGLQGD